MATTSKKKVTKKKASKKKSVAKKAAKKKVVSKKKASTTKSAKQSTTSGQPGTSPIDISAEERWKMVAVAAYHRAEKRGFTPGHELEDWTASEREIDKLLSGGKM